MPVRNERNARAYYDSFDSEAVELLFGLVSGPVRTNCLDVSFNRPDYLCRD
jgi:hypothetical protein